MCVLFQSKKIHLQSRNKSRKIINIVFMALASQVEVKLQEFVDDICWSHLRKLKIVFAVNFEENYGHVEPLFVSYGIYITYW